MAMAFGSIPLSRGIWLRLVLLRNGGKGSFRIRSLHAGNLLERDGVGILFSRHGDGPIADGGGERVPLDDGPSFLFAGTTGFGGFYGRALRGNDFQHCPLFDVDGRSDVAAFCKHGAACIRKKMGADDSVFHGVDSLRGGPSLVSERGSMSGSAALPEISSGVFQWIVDGLCHRTRRLRGA